MALAAKEEYEFDGSKFELVVYRAGEDRHLRGFVSSGGFSDRIVEMPGEAASDMKMGTGNDPVETLMSAMKDEVNAGKL